MKEKEYFDENFTKADLIEGSNEISVKTKGNKRKNEAKQEDFSACLCESRKTMLMSEEAQKYQEENPDDGTIFIDESFFYSEIVNRLRETEGDEAVLVLLEMVGYQNSYGYFEYLPDIEESLSEQIAWKINEDPEVVETVLDLLKRLKKFVVVDMYRFCIVNLY